MIISLYHHFICLLFVAYFQTFTFIFVELIFFDLIFIFDFVVKRLIFIFPMIVV